MGFDILSRFATKLHQEGVKKTAIDAFTLFYDYYYDFRYKLDTYAWVSKEDLINESETAKFASSYQATKVLPLRTLFKKLNVPKDAILVDIGSGKGRVLLVASEFCFKEVRGVELSKLLCDIAEDNIETYKKRVSTNTNFEIINMDASQYKFRDDEYMFFLYNPFNHQILSKVLKNISDSLERNSRPIQIVYAYPVDRTYIENFFTIKSIQDLQIWKGEFTVYNL